MAILTKNCAWGLWCYYLQFYTVLAVAALSPTIFSVYSFDSPTSILIVIELPLNFLRDIARCHSKLLDHHCTRSHLYFTIEHIRRFLVTHLPPYLKACQAFARYDKTRSNLLTWSLSPLRRQDSQRKTSRTLIHESGDTSNYTTWQLTDNRVQHIVCLLSKREYIFARFNWCILEL